MDELGRYPLMLEVLLNMLSYYVRLLNSDDILLKEAFFVSERLANENKGSWTSCVKAICRFLGLSPVKFKRKNQTQGNKITTGKIYFEMARRII